LEALRDIGYYFWHRRLKQLRQDILLAADAVQVIEACDAVGRSVPTRAMRPSGLASSAAW
jgi:hypothetical protein